MALPAFPRYSGSDAFFPQPANAIPPGPGNPQRHRQQPRPKTIRAPPLTHLPDKPEKPCQTSPNHPGRIRTGGQLPAVATPSRNSPNFPSPPRYPVKTHPPRPQRRHLTQIQRCCSKPCQTSPSQPESGSRAEPKTAQKNPQKPYPVSHKLLKFKTSNNRSDLPLRPPFPLRTSHRPRLSEAPSPTLSLFLFLPV
jgi:hypothetical protein